MRVDYERKNLTPIFTAWRICSLKEAEKYLKIKNGLPLVRNLLARNYIQIKETVDDLFREKKERIVTWQKSIQRKNWGRCWIA